MMLSCCIKNEIKISTLSGDILVFSLIVPEHFGDKIQKQAVKLLEMTRCRISKQILKNGIQMIGQNAVLTS